MLIDSTVSIDIKRPLLAYYSENMYKCELQKTQSKNLI